MIIGIGVLVNDKRLMGEHTAGPLLNAGLLAALAFALVISYKGIFSLIAFFSSGA